MTDEIPKNASESEGSEVENEGSPAQVVDTLTIPVSIELSRIRLSLKELGALKDGQIIDLNKKPGEFVDLIVSGKIIGKGELVEVEGELGVRVSSLIQ